MVARAVGECIITPRRVERKGCFFMFDRGAGPRFLTDGTKTSERSLFPKKNEAIILCTAKHSLLSLSLGVETRRWLRGGEEQKTL